MHSRPARWMELAGWAGSIRTVFGKCLLSDQKSQVRELAHGPRSPKPRRACLKPNGGAGRAWLKCKRGTETNMVVTETERVNRTGIFAMQIIKAGVPKAG